MPDMSVIASMLTSLKVATDLTRLLKEIGSSFEAAEWKMKLADLTSALADLKIASSEIKDMLNEKDAEICKLKDALETKKRVVKYLDSYYEIGSEGNPVGDPYCLNCWESQHILRHLVMASSGNIRECPACKHKYAGRRVSYRSQDGE